MEWFFLWIILSIVAGVIASGKGRSGFGYFLLSILLSPLVGIILALVASSIDQKNQELARQEGEGGDYRKCPSCAEAIRREAVKCRYCGTEVEPVAGAKKTGAYYTGKKIGELFRGDS